MQAIKKVYRLALEQKTFWVQAIDVMSLRDTEDYVRDFRLQVQPLLTGEPWALVLDVRLWQPSPQQTFALFKDNTLWCFAHNLHFCVVLLPEDPLLAWQFVKATDVERPAHFVSERATDETEARNLLRARGYLTSTV